jgi:hypothetical protein
VRLLGFVFTAVSKKSFRQRLHEVMEEIASRSREIPELLTILRPSTPPSGRQGSFSCNIYTEIGSVRLFWAMIWCSRLSASHSGRLSGNFAKAT